MHTIFDRKIIMLKPCEIKIPLKKTSENNDCYSLYSLAQSVKSIGIITPLTVCKNENGKYVLISGQRRLQAAKIVGLRRIPCIIHKAEESEIAIISLVDNLQRESPDFFKMAEEIKQVMEKYKIPRDEITRKLGISKNALLERLRLLRIEPTLRQIISENKLSESHARSLLRLPPERREESLEHIIKNNLDAQLADEYITHLLGQDKPLPKEPQKKEPLPVRKSAIGDIRLFGNSLSKLTGILKDSGIDAYIRRTETDRYIEYKVRIKKEELPKISAEQLKIC